MISAFRTPWSHVQWPFGPRRCGLPRHAPLRETKAYRSEEHTSELQSLTNLVCRLLLEKKKIFRDSARMPVDVEHARAAGPCCQRARTRLDDSDRYGLASSHQRGYGRLRVF